MAQDLKQLEMLAEKYGTDKLSHGYLTYYAQHLPDKCDRLLEIGAFQGASLRMWKELYPDAEIVCFDLFLDPDNISKDEVEKLGVTAIQGNQEFEHDLSQIEGVFDVIIEDGSHRSDHQIITLRALWEKVKQGGVYVVEDLHCCNDPFYWAGVVKNFKETLLWQMKHAFYFSLPGLKRWEVYRDKIGFIFRD